MPELLKNLYNQTFFQKFLTNLSQLIQFDKDRFYARTINSAQWENLELKQRSKLITNTLSEVFTSLDLDYKEQTDVLIKLTKIVLGKEEFKMNFLYMFVPNYIEFYGLQHYSNSITAIEEITKCTSCEFAIRPFLQKYPETIEVMLEWSNHSNPMVRRLASEGSRPRLPWGKALTEYKKNPLPILPILDNLILDENEIVRRSVANNLNDISKDNPQIVLDYAKNWIQKNKETKKTLKHGLRTLLKMGNQEALSIFGLEYKDNFRILQFSLDKTHINLGEKLSFNVNIQCCENSNKKAHVEYRLEYIISFLKANGTYAHKVFQIGTYSLLSGENVSITKRHLIKNFSTRKIYLGLHKISLQVNGKVVETLEFEVT